MTEIRAMVRADLNRSFSWVNHAVRSHGPAMVNRPPRCVKFILACFDVLIGALTLTSIAHLKKSRIDLAERWKSCKCLF